MKWYAAILVIGVLGYVVGTASTHQPVQNNAPPTELPGASPAGPSAQSRQYTVLLDVSASRPGSMVSEGRKFVDAVIDDMNYGDRLVMLEMYEAGVKDEKRDLDVSLTKSEDVTTLEEQESLSNARKGLKESVNLFFQNAQKQPVEHTDILTTLSIASEKVSSQNHSCLILLSDMLQSSQQFEFEHLKRMPGSGWIDQQEAQGLIRPLYGSSVVVIGADPSTREGVVVREFWRKYFAVSNASLATEKYRTTPPSAATACF